MSDLKDLFESFYSKFVLRDFFGKVVPGLGLLLAASVALTSPSDVRSYVQSIGFVAAVGILGFAWLAGFAAQSFGETLRLIRYYPQCDAKGKALIDHAQRAWV